MGPSDNFLDCSLLRDPVLLDPVEDEVVPVGGVQLPDLLPECLHQGLDLLDFGAGRHGRLVYLGQSRLQQGLHVSELVSQVRHTLLGLALQLLASSDDPFKRVQGKPLK